MLSRGMALVPILALTALLSSAHAADQEGCLFCHRLELARTGTRVSDLRVTEPPGKFHDGVYCSDCHPDAKMAPHTVTPGAARCIDECHANGAGNVPESHRRAAFGGTTESHRHAAMPSSPCLFCHRADDPPSAAFPASARCKGCHAGEALSVAEGVHGGLATNRPGGACPACHVPHPSGMAGSRTDNVATCRGAGCHEQVTDRMKALGGHGKGAPGERPKRIGALLLFLVACLAGLIPGRWLCGNGPLPEGDER